MPVADMADSPGVMAESEFSARVIDWYDANARDLPWRADDATPWGVLVSEVMLQQTPVARVTPVWLAWLTRWPSPSALAAAPCGEAVRAWGRLGYPRRALRLHEAATAMVDRHEGEVPASYDDLLALPGVGAYTAAAVAVFGFGQRHAVLDTNVRRVYARALHGDADAATPSPSMAERKAALDLVPTARAARHSVAVMELGALVCTSQAPRCGACPLVASCAWHAAGRPDGRSPRRPQTYAGTDRQARGRLLAVLREAEGDVDQAALDAVWDDVPQRERALGGLLSDGLIQSAGAGRYRLPA
jgi:A/G-specific adenine glycosylase